MSSDADADPCALCDRSLRDREKATKSILCRQCKKKLPCAVCWCPNKVTRSKSVSAGSSGPIDTDGDPEDSVFIVSKELSHIEEKLNSVIKIAEKTGRATAAIMREKALARVTCGHKSG
ncbi:hypothetical protein DMENIID0001_141720 [Sergentomyia squamirostris]